MPSFVDVHMSKGEWQLWLIGWHCGLSPLLFCFMWKASNFHISINRHELLHRNCTHYINNDLPWMSSRGLIWSTSKSLGFFLLITADQALSRFSLFKSAFNVSLMLDVAPAEDCDLLRRGATTASCPMVWCDPVGDTKELLCTCAGLPGRGEMGSNTSSCSCQWSLGPSGYNSVLWSTEGNESLLAWLGATCLQASLQGCVQGLTSPPKEHWRKTSAISRLYPAISSASIWKTDFSYFLGV